MNNDISRDIAGYNKIPAANTKIEKQKAIEAVSLTVPCDKSVENLLGCLGSMGCAKVSMDRNLDSVKKSVEYYKSNPFEVESRVNFCDGLVEKGYNLYQAMDITDKVFENLKNKNTYRN